MRELRETDDMLTLEETERLCGLYMECRLSVLEEAELQYVLGRLPYSSPVIDDTRRVMALGATPLATAEKRGRRRRPMLHWFSGIAAAVVFAFAVSLWVGHPEEGVSDSGNMVMAYESGRMLGPEDAQVSVHNAMAKANALMAEGRKQEKTAMEKAVYYMNLKSERK